MQRPKNFFKRILLRGIWTVTGTSASLSPSFDGPWPLLGDSRVFHQFGPFLDIFLNRRGEKMTRFGVRYLLRKYVAVASHAVPTLSDKHIHPHSLRHTTAIYLLKAGVDFATISQWLGHSSLNTTMRYARADIDLKRQALTQVFPDALAPPKAGSYLPIGANLTDWLRRL